MGEGGSAKTLHWSISLFSKMGDKGEGGDKSLKKWVTSFMDGPNVATIYYLDINYILQAYKGYFYFQNK